MVLHWTRGMSHEPLPHLGWVVLTFGSAMTVGCLCYLGVERPMLNLFRKSKGREKSVSERDYPLQTPGVGGQRTGGLKICQFPSWGRLPTCHCVRPVGNLPKKGLPHCS